MADQDSSIFSSLGLSGQSTEQTAPETDSQLEQTGETVTTTMQKTAPEADSPDNSTDKAPKEDDSEKLKAENARLKAERDALDKRAKDNQAAFTKAQQRLKELEKQQPKGDSWFDENGNDHSEESESNADKTPDANPAVEELNNKVQRLEQESEQHKIEKWRGAEASFKAEHPDYEKIVYDLLEPAMQKEDATAALLRQEFISKGGTPEAAYEIARRYQALTAPETAVEDPTNNSDKSRRVAARSASANSASPPPGADGGGSPSVLDRVLR